MDRPPPRNVKFASNPIAGLVRARREDVRENSSRFVHLNLVVTTFRRRLEASTSIGRPPVRANEADALSESIGIGMARAAKARVTKGNE